MNYGCDSLFVIHVSKSGNDGNGGVAQQYPVSLANDSKLTIGSALSACPDGGTIVIWPGVYDEEINLVTAAKSINLTGTQREKCIISKNTTNPVVKLYAGSRMENLRVEQSGSGMTVSGDNQDEIQVLNCSIVGGNAAIDGLYLAGAENCIVRDCYIKAAYDALYISREVLVDNCIIVTNGLASGSGVARAIAIADSTRYVIIRNSIIIAQPSYETTVGGPDPLYQSDRELSCIHNGGDVILENCFLLADGYKPMGANAGSYATGHAYCTNGMNRLVAKNCIFRARTDQNQATTNAYCITAGNASLINCILSSEGTNESWDIQHGFTSTVYLVNTRYDSSKVHSNVTLRVLPDDTDRLNRAAKTLLNKAVQTKTTSVIDYYDDDGQTVILTHTPTDGESAITRVPS